MSNSFNYRFGQTEMVKFAVDSATVIEIGDLVYLNTDDVKPAADLTWDTNLATTQADFADVFAGVAAEQSASGDTDSIDIDISPMSVYEFAVASATYEIGDKLGPDQSGGTALLSQQLEEAVAASAVAVAYERKTSATRLKVKFASALNPASSNANISLG